jgi:hypothetical protein
MKRLDRRSFLENLTATAAAFVLAPVATACSGDDSSASTTTTTTTTSGADDPLAIPRTKPAAWDPIAFNRERGNAGAIPESYRADINGPDGPMKHLGKHLPYVPAVDRSAVPAGFIALMWGDPSVGHAKHPNAVRNESNHNEGHWYDTITIRKAVEGPAAEMESTYPEWPTATGNGAYASLGGGPITADDGKNTIYLARLPDDVRSGDLVRIHAHCLTHGEYVDFLTVP